MNDDIVLPEKGLTENEKGYVCSNCGEVWDYRNGVTTGAIDVSELDIERICPSIDAGFVIHTGNNE